jgi:hypothetical protein
MGHASLLSAPVLEQFLIQSRLTKAVASLRLHGTNARLLGDLHLHTFRVGTTLELAGLHVRDSVPADGTPVTLTILLGDEVLTLESTLLTPIHDEAGTPLLRLAWPTEPARLHHRRDVRVAGPDQTPLKVRVGLEGRQLDALLVNLTETGVGLAFDMPLMVDLHTSVDIDAELPGGAFLQCPGEVRHLTYLEGQDYPTRLGVVLQPEADTDLEPMHRFIQERRTDRSHTSKKN